MFNDSSPLYQLLDKSISGLGYELLGFEQVQEAGGNVLRIYIDHENGIVIKDCETVSRHISGVLDVEDLVRGQYFLEVSSPGVDRPLFKPEHYQRHSGAMVQIRLSRMLDGRRKFKGELRGMQDHDVIIVIPSTKGSEGEEQQEIKIPFSLIEKGRLISDDI